MQEGHRFCYMASPGCPVRFHRAAKFKGRLDPSLAKTLSMTNHNKNTKKCKIVIKDPVLYRYCIVFFHFSGCKNAIVNFEARPLDAQMYTRRCVIAKLKELTVEKYKGLMSQAAGALVVILPQSLQELSEEDKTVSNKSILQDFPAHNYSAFWWELCIIKKLTL